MSKKQTAVEWLERNMPNISEHIPLGIALEFIAKLNHAKEIEKEQLKDAHLAGQNSAEEIDGENEIEYYKNTFGDAS
jgi:hypothetical protein